MKKKILWLSDSPLTTTGFATITWNVLNKLSDEYECHCLGHNLLSQKINPGITFEDNTKIDFHLHGCGKAQYGMDVISPIIRKYKIDIFGGLLDTFMMYQAGFLGIDTSPARTFFYYPSDGGGTLPTNCESVLKKVEVPISMSKYGKLQVEKIYGIKSEYIPHGYDSKTFYKLSDEEKQKLRIKWGLQNKFVVGVVARNQGRKMLDRTIKAFTLFAKTHQDAILLLHLDPNDGAQSFNIMSLIDRFNLKNRVVYTGTTFYNPFNYKAMNEVYNLMDVFFLSTSGEGFGVPIIEAMACGVPQLVTDYTTTKELVLDDGKSGEAILLVGEKEDCPYPHTNEVIDGSLTGTWEVERGMMSVYDANKKLSDFYNSWKLKDNYIDDLVKNSIKKSKEIYEWDKIMPMWKNVMSKLL